MKYTLYLATFAFAILFHASAWAQYPPVERSNSRYGDGITESLREEVIRGVEEKLHQYIDRCSMAGPDGEITDASYESFFDLFEGDARLCQDFLEPAQPDAFVSLSDYTIKVEEYFRSTGIRSTVKSAALIRMVRDNINLRYIVTEIRISRQYDHLLDDNTQRLVIPSQPVVRDFVITFSTHDALPDDAIISTIRFADRPEDPLPDPEADLSETGDHQSGGSAGLSDLIDNATDRGGLDAQTVGEIATRVWHALELYKSAARLGGSKGEKAQENRRKFETLFISSTSRHIDDFEQYPSRDLTPEKYADGVKDVYGTDGLSFDLYNLRITKIEPKAYGDYNVDVHAEKRLFAYRDAKEKFTSRPKTLKIHLQYYLTADNIKLEGVYSREDLVKYEKRESYIAFSSSIGLLVIKADPKPGIQFQGISGPIAEKTALSASPSIGAGMEFRTNILSGGATSKPFYLVVGAGYSRFTLFSTVSGFSYIGNPDTGNALENSLMPNMKYTHDIDHLEDKISISMLEAPVGVDYRLWKNDKKQRLMEVFAGVRIIPAYTLAANHTYTINTFYNLAYPDAGFAFYDAGRNFMLNPDDSTAVITAYNIGYSHQDRNDYKGKTIERVFVLGYELGLQAHVSLLKKGNKDVKIVAGARYRGYTSFFVQGTAPGNFPHYNRPVAGEDRSSVLQDYYDNHRAGAILFSLGVTLPLHRR